MIVTADELAAMARQAGAEYPAECCGVVLVRGEARRVLPFRNAQDEMHARDPVRYPRTSREAYCVSREDFERMDGLTARGWALSVIYHSHVDVGAYFSETDKRNALMGQDEPLWGPDTTYVVLSVEQGRVNDAKAFRWCAGRRDFEPVGLGVDPGILTEGR